MDPRGGGTVFDRSGYGHLGTLTNGPTWDYDDYGNGALRCPAWSHVAASSFAWPVGGPVTVSLRQITPGGTQSGLIGVGNNVTERFHCHGPWLDNNFYWDYGFIEAGGRVSASYSAYLNQWTAISLVSQGVEGPFKAIYFNGQQAATASATRGPLVALSGLSINASLGYIFGNTTVSDVRIYRLVQPAALVWDVYDRPAALAYPLGRRQYHFFSAQLSSASSRRCKALSGLTGISCP